MRVCFVLGRLGPSGGVRAVLEHARRLAATHDMEVAIAVAEGPAEGAVPPEVELIRVEQAQERQFDLAVATWWQTVYPLFRIPARRRAYFVQNFEERLYRPGDVERLGAALTHGLPLAFLTEAAWVRDELAELRPDAVCHHIPNGIDKQLFSPPATPPNGTGRLRVLVEGAPSLWFKGVREALDVLALMREEREVTLVSPEPPPAEIANGVDRVLGPLAHDQMPAVYSEAHVVLKLSRVEGVFGPPLEAFHRGTTCVVWPVTGHDEYVRHRANGIVAEWDDIPGTARWLDILATDRDLLSQLRHGALDTARQWPSWEQSAELMATAVREIATGPEPPSGAGVPQLLADAHAGIEGLRLEQLRLRRELDRRDAALGHARDHLETLERHVARLEGSPVRRWRARARRLLASGRR
jgi:O-antigen biosynthesis protein